MSETILVKTKTCCVCGQYEMWSLDKDSVLRWHNGEHIQRVFPDMSPEDREIMISGTHPACWNELFPVEESDDDE